MGNFKSYRQLRVSERKETSLGQKSFEKRDLKFAKSGEKKKKTFIGSKRSVNPKQDKFVKNNT